MSVDGEEKLMDRPELRPEPNGPEPVPPPPHIFITPINSSITLNSGQSITVSFVLAYSGTIIPGITETPVSLSVGSVPPGITAALSSQSLPLPSPATSSAFSLTLTAAQNVTPAEATIEVRAVHLAAAASATVTVNAVASGQVWPTYQILTVLYAPPGTNGGNSKSQVSYGSGSTTGTTDSTSNSFKDSVDVSASVSNILGINLGVSGDFTASQTGTTTSQVNINKGANYQINVTGPDADGINHSNDLFYLWLNPQLNVTVDHLGNVAWEIGVNGQEMQIQYVYAEWLLNPSLMPSGVAQILAAAGLTTADYDQILACNPFYAGAATGDPNRVVPIDPGRFVPTAQSFPYEPPLAAGDPVPTIAYTQTSSTTTTNTQEVQTQYGVSVSVTAGFSLIFSDTLKVTGSLQWTNTSTSTQTTGSTQQASVTVGGPAFGYTGPTDILVFWDTVYLSFMFAFATGSPSASGTLTDSAGNPVPNKAITLTMGGITLSTFTNSRGQYNFYGTAPGQGTVTVENQQFPVAIGAGEPSPTLRLNAPA
jgi:Carboxypeptidase regulatory-like domain